MEVRESLYLNADEIPSFLDQARESLSECFVLSTCNRTEIYGVSDSPEIDPHFYKDLLIDFKNARGIVGDEHFFTAISCAACEHLFEVATSVGSMFVGDSQILRQLRQAYKIAIENRGTGSVLNQLVQRALKVGKKTYTETAVHAGTASVSAAAVDFATKTFGSLSGKRVLIIGSGETARLAAEALLNKNIGRLTVANRTRAHAEQLAALIRSSATAECSVINFDELSDHLDLVDIVISSTSSEEPILHKKDFDARSREILLIDIAVPRDIDERVSENPNVILKNVDDLNAIIDENYERRRKAVPQAKKLIMKESIEFLSWYYSLSIATALASADELSKSQRRTQALNVKAFLTANLSDIHKLAVASTGDVRQDLKNHFSLIQNLQIKAAATLGARP